MTSCLVSHLLYLLRLLDVSGCRSRGGLEYIYEARGLERVNRWSAQGAEKNCEETWYAMNMWQRP